MPRSLYSVLFVLTVIVHHPVFAGDRPLLPKALVGRYGFDWYHPDNAQCQRIDEQSTTRFLRCEQGTSGSFTARTGYAVCQIKNGEFLVYETKIRCQEELATMQANAP